MVHRALPLIELLAEQQGKTVTLCENKPSIY